MQTIKKSVIAVLMAAMLITACDTVFETNLANRSIQVLAPVDNFSTDRNELFFWWELDEDAIQYRLQIVTPVFDSTEQLLADTILTTENFTISLSPGRYQWRLRAENNSSFSPYVTRSLEVVSSDSIGNQSVILIAPEDDYHTNQTNTILSWFSLNAADDYRLNIEDENGSLIIPSILVTDTQQTVQLDEGIYIWKVQANSTNGSGQTNSTVFSSRKLTIDTSQPDAALLNSPINGISVDSATEAVFNWTSGQAGTSTEFDQLEVYSDSFSTLYTKVDMVSSPHLLQGLQANSLYYWRIRTYDLAGNEVFSSNSGFFNTP